MEPTADLSHISVAVPSCATRQRGAWATIALTTISGVVVTAFVLFALPALADRPQAARHTVMVFGDSLSSAYGLKPDEGWVALMANRLSARGVAVINASISGETTSGGLRRIKGDIERNKPTLVVVALGANDGLRGLPVAETQRNLAGMLDVIKHSGARAVVVGIQIPPNFGIEYAGNFKNLYVVLAAERRLPLVPFLLNGIAENFDNFLPDRLHPSAEAQPRILQNVLPVIERALLVTPAGATARETPRP